MALEVEWYDLVCIGIIGVSFLGALWVLWMKEGASKGDLGTLDETLLGIVVPKGIAMGHVSATQLWTSCWRGVHPLYILATRFFSFVILVVLLSLDVREYDASIFVYYTEYWLRWQVPVCAFILILSVMTALMHIVKAKPQPLYHNQLWIPCWIKLSPLWLFLYRAFAFLCLARIHFDIIALDGAFSFYFYTQWTFTLVMIYFALGTIISAHGCWQYLNQPPLENEEMAEFLRRDLEDSMSTNSIAYKEKETKGSIRLQSQYVEEEFKQRVGFWGYLMQIIYQTSAGASILTDIVFWCVIVPFLSISHFKLNMLMGCMHSLNAVFLLLDTALSNLSCILCALELWLHNFPMDHPRLWFYMVSELGGNSHTLLWHVFINSESEKYDSSQILPSCIFEGIL
ncbi:hypothetical protein CR513_63006, partial [Mucuna pruriens]